MAVTQPWLRLNAAAHADTRVRKARAGAVWPWVLCRLKDGQGIATDDMLDPWRAGEDLHVPEALAADQIEGLKRVGLLVTDDETGHWTTPGWAEYQPDPRGSWRQRAQKKKKRPREPRESQDVQGTPGFPRIPADGTGRDETRQDPPTQEAPSVPPASARPSASPSAPEGVEAAEAAYRQTFGGLFPPRSVMEALPQLVATYGVAELIAAMHDAHTSGLSSPTARILEDRVKGARRRRKGTRARQPAQQRNLDTWERREEQRRASGAPAQEPEGFYSPDQIEEMRRVRAEKDAAHG